MKALACTLAASFLLLFKGAALGETRLPASDVVQLLGRTASCCCSGCWTPGSHVNS